MDNTNDSSKIPGTEKAETISELAKRHLTDENHTTTDAEIRNAKVQFSENIHEDAAMEELFEADNETVFPPLPGESDIISDTSDEDDAGKSSPPNPYNVLE